MWTTKVKTDKQDYIKIKRIQATEYKSNRMGGDICKSYMG